MIIVGKNGRIQDCFTILFDDVVAVMMMMMMMMMMVMVMMMIVSKNFCSVLRFERRLYK